MDRRQFLHFGRNAALATLALPALLNLGAPAIEQAARESAQAFEYFFEDGTMATEADWWAWIER